MTILNDNSEAQDKYNLIILDTQGNLTNEYCEFSKTVKIDSNSNYGLDPLYRAYTLSSLGFSALLTKPVKQSQLFDCIVTVINKSSNDKLAHPLNAIC